MEVFLLRRRQGSDSLDNPKGPRALLTAVDGVRGAGDGDLQRVTQKGFVETFPAVALRHVRVGSRPHARLDFVRR